MLSTSHAEDGAHARIRTGDLFLTKEMLYRLSYVGGASDRFYPLDPGGQLMAARDARTLERRSRDGEIQPRR